MRYVDTVWLHFQTKNSSTFAADRIINIIYFFFRLYDRASYITTLVSRQNCC